MKHFDDIKDNEIRIISGQRESAKPFFRRWWFWLIVVFVVSLLIACILLLHKQRNFKEDIVTEQVSESVMMAPTVMQTEPATVIVCDTMINDVVLQVYIPINAVPELCLGIPNAEDSSIVLALQAADIRADNRKIVGAFVLKGEPLAWGLSKKGYCAIIDGKTQIGMAENSPLFEEATEKQGYFFRQYPLVNKGVMVENKPKGKAMRRALCQLNGQVAVVSTIDRESLHDFAQALVDLGVYQAIYLTGGSAYGFCRCEDGSIDWWGEPLWKEDKRIPSSINFIVWKKAETLPED